MPGPRQLRLRRPWSAVVDVSSPYPARFLASLVAQSLQYGRPAARRGGRALAWWGRRDLPEDALGAALRAYGFAVARGADDVRLRDLREAWPQLQAADPTLPPPGALSTLRLHRRSAVTTFVFGDEPGPLLVSKLPHDGHDDVDVEVDALREASAVATALAPLHLGQVDGWGQVQRGLRGRAMRVRPVSPATASALPWTRQHQALADGLDHLGRATRKPAPHAAWMRACEERSLEHPAVRGRLEGDLRAAASALAEQPVSVLAHVDTSPQNVLFDGERLSGLVDWGDATSLGDPGADLLNAAIASIEQGAGLRRWDEATVRACFERGYLESPLGTSARRAAARTAAGVGVPPELAHAAELLMFARRLGWRMRPGHDSPTSSDLALSALLAVHAAGPVH